MATIEVTLPKMGESVAEATVTTWLVKEGDSVEAEESIVEIATDKVDSEVPAPEDGVIKEIKVQEGDVANVGDVIAVMEIEGESSGSDDAAASDNAPAETDEQPAAAAQPQEDQKPAASSQPADFSQSERFYSPLVKSIAKEENISLSELESIDGSGQNGRVTKADILGYIESGRPSKGDQKAAPQPQQQEAPAKPQQQKSEPAKPAKSYSGNVEVVEMDRMRKIIAKNMVDSKHTSAHVTSFVEADVTNVVNWRNKVKKKFQEREGEKLTFTPIFIEAMVKAIKDFPDINISLDGENIVKKRDINMGMAAALPSGNLILPVIHNADQLNLVGLTKKVNDLANRARNNKLTSDEIQGGTYTISNVGSFGNLMGTPIIPQPQVAIMAVGSIQKKPVVIETESGDVIGIRHMMFLSHSYDHRVVDGALGGMFVKRVAEYLENFDVNREI